MLVRSRHAEFVQVQQTTVEGRHLMLHRMMVTSVTLEVCGRHVLASHQAI